MHPLIGPVLVLALLTAIVWTVMYIRRVRENVAKRIDPQRLASRRHAIQLLEDTDAADNFSNLFEAPVLFYALVALVVASGQPAGVLLVMAWTYVGLRVLHSVIHITYNTVLHRFGVYVISSLVLWSMWAVFAVRYLSATAA